MMTTFALSRQPSIRGFTLLEILLSVTLTVILTMILAHAAVQVGETGQLLESELDRSGKASLVLDLLASDLQTCLLRQDENVWLAVDVLAASSNSGSWVSASGQKPKASSLLLKPPLRPEESLINPEDYRFGMGGMWIRFFASVEDRSRSNNGEKVAGEINAVAYQIVRRELTSITNLKDKTNAGYQLFRSVVRADHVFNTGYQIDTYAGPSHAGYPGEIKEPRLDSAVCDQVIDLGIVLYQRNEAGEIVEGFPNRDISLPKLQTSLQYRSPQDGIPTQAELYVRVLSLRGARELRWREQGTFGADEWWKFAAKESRVFSRSLSLPRAL